MHCKLFPVVVSQRLDVLGQRQQALQYGASNLFYLPVRGLADLTPAGLLSTRVTRGTVYQEIFDEIVLLAIRKKWISGRVLYTDFTHLKASANKNTFKKAQVEASPRSYLEDLESAITTDRQAHRRKPLKQEEPVVKTREVKKSTTDSDSG